MEESHKTHRPHIKVGKDEDKKRRVMPNRRCIAYNRRLIDVLILIDVVLCLIDV